MLLPIALQRLIVVKIFFLSLCGHGLIKGRHSQIHMALKNQLRHEAVKQSQKQGGNVRAIHIRIGHDDDLIITQLCNVKIVSISFRKAAAEGVDHGLDLRVCQHLVNARLFHVQNLSTDGQDSLIGAVPCHLGAAAGGISLYDEDLAFRSVTGFTVCQLAVGIKGKLLFGEQIRFGPLLALSDLRRLLRAADDVL